MNIKEGEKVPDFSLVDQNEKIVTLESLKGKPAVLAIKLRRVLDAPVGLYNPVSHSLIVCCLTPSSSESTVCE